MHLLHALQITQVCVCVSNFSYTLFLRFYRAMLHRALYVIAILASRPSVGYNGLHKIVYELSIAAKMRDLKRPLISEIQGCGFINVSTAMSNITKNSKSSK